jgi:N-methylhydantoinase B
MTGGAAAPAADAWMTIGHVGNAGLCNIDSVELDEQRQPIHVYARKLVPDSEGAGRHRGAPSIAVEFGPAGCDISVGYVSDGVVNAAKGVRGGGDGGGANQFRLLPNDGREQLDACAQVLLKDGERLLSISCGGGGYGNPADRDAAVVARDVAEGWITPKRAADIYRVAIAADGTLDAAGTAALRKS